MINLIAGIGLVAAPLAAMSSDFGGGWKLDKNTGTLYNPNHAPVETQSSHSHGNRHAESNLNSFGGGFVQDKTTGTSYYSLAGKNRSKSSSDAAHRHAENKPNSFGGGLVQDMTTGTTYYSGS